ncbi:hypothetical protein D3C81_2072270 [compost metagenome]
METATVAPFSNAAFTPLVASLLLISASDTAKAAETTRLSETASAVLEKWGLNMLPPR